jgi:hypothetical protein
MIDELQRLIGTNEVVEVEITQGLGGFPYKTTNLMDLKGMDCIRIGPNSILFLALQIDFTEESYMIVLTIPKDVTLVSKDIEKREITGANFSIVGHNTSSSLTFSLYCKKEE